MLVAGLLLGSQAPVAGQVKDVSRPNLMTQRLGPILSPSRSTILVFEPRSSTGTLGKWSAYPERSAALSKALNSLIQDKEFFSPLVVAIGSSLIVCEYAEKTFQVVETKGRISRRKFSTVDLAFGLASDSRQHFYVLEEGTDGVPCIRMYSKDGRFIRQLRDPRINRGYLAGSPDGKWICYERNSPRKMVVMSTVTGQVYEISDTNRAEKSFNPPVFRSDSKALLYLSDRETYSKLWLANLHSIQVGAPISNNPYNLIVLGFFPGDEVLFLQPAQFHSSPTTMQICLTLGRIGSSQTQDLFWSKAQRLSVSFVER